MSRCWMCDEGGDRCVLKMDHPGPHMAGFHVFEKTMSAESIARTMGIAYDTLTSEVARLRRELEEAKTELASEEEANRLAAHDVQDAYERECARLRADLAATEDALLREREVHERLARERDAFGDAVERVQALCAPRTSGPGADPKINDGRSVTVAEILAALNPSTEGAK